jgi:ankyrin repeat protein
MLKLCKSELDKDDCDTAMTQLLGEMGISPITTPGTTEDTLIATSSGGITAAAAVSQEEEDEETPANLRNTLNEVWNGETVLHVAAASGNASLIPILLLHGADPAIK